MTKYIRVKESYCGCISVQVSFLFYFQKFYKTCFQYFAIIASCITLAFQLTFSIFFLIYGQLWGLIPMALTIASHLFFMIVILQFKSTISITIYSGIEVSNLFQLKKKWNQIIFPDSVFFRHFRVFHLDFIFYTWSKSILRLQFLCNKIVIHKLLRWWVIELKCWFAPGNCCKTCPWYHRDQIF